MNAINIDDVKEELKIPDQIKIFDTTLRDGEQAPGIALTVDEKIKIAQKLDELGVDTIEMGFPTVSEGERKAAKRMVELGFKSNICGLARVLKKDIDAVIDSDLSYAHLFIGTSPLHRDYKLKKSKEEILNQAIEAVEYAKDHGLTVEFSAEDATRTELNYLIEFYKGVEGAGADIINVPDTVGILVPSTTRDLIRILRKKINVPISLHFHNDFGLAVSNSIIGIEEGANQAHCTINGIGERAGNTSLEELVVSLKIAYGANIGVDTTKLYDTSNFIGSITGIKMPPTKPIVGENAFAHESGIHVDGILKNTSTYEPISPELVGHKRRIALGKHTGHAGIKSKLEEFNIEVSPKQFENIYNQVKTLGLRPSALTTRELITLVLTYLLQTKLGDQALQFLHLILTWFARHLQYRKDIILHAHLTEDTGLLGQIADTRTGSFIHRVVGHLMVAQVDMAAVRQHQSCCHVERGGLTGTVRSEQTDDLPLFHMKTDVVDHSALPIALDEAFRA